MKTALVPSFVLALSFAALTPALASANTQVKAHAAASVVPVRTQGPELLSGAGYGQWTTPGLVNGNALAHLYDQDGTRRYTLKGDATYAIAQGEMDTSGLFYGSLVAPGELLDVEGSFSVSLDGTGRLSAAVFVAIGQRPIGRIDGVFFLPSDPESPIFSDSMAAALLEALRRPERIVTIGKKARGHQAASFAPLGTGDREDERIARDAVLRRNSRVASFEALGNRGRDDVRISRDSEKARDHLAASFAPMGGAAREDERAAGDAALTRRSRAASLEALGSRDRGSVRISRNEIESEQSRDHQAASLSPLGGAAREDERDARDATLTRRSRVASLEALGSRDREDVRISRVEIESEKARDHQAASLSPLSADERGRQHGARKTMVAKKAPRHQSASMTGFGGSDVPRRPVLIVDPVLGSEEGYVDPTLTGITVPLELRWSILR